MTHSVSDKKIYLTRGNSMMDFDVVVYDVVFTFVTFDVPGCSRDISPIGINGAGTITGNCFIVQTQTLFLSASCELAMVPPG
jgi:hypothetical protein